LETLKNRISKISTVNCRLQCEKVQLDTVGKWTLQVQGVNS